MQLPAEVGAQAAPGILIREASEREVAEAKELVRAAIASNPADSHLESFRHELTADPDPAERYIQYVVLVGGKLAARCKINFCTQASDIDAYGEVAAELHARERMGALTGDLVAPAFRGLGLHAAMIRYRIGVLKSLGYTYAVCGIIVDNAPSEVNYVRLGFQPIGEKDIDWGVGAVGDRIKRVVLYGLRLTDE